MGTPMPGSDEAQKDGCTCPKDENQGGQGANIASASGDQRYFVVAEQCPMHGFAQTS